MAKIIPENEYRFKGQASQFVFEDYPFMEWLDGRIWQLKRGVDWPKAITVKNFTSKVYEAAKQIDCKVRCSINGGSDTLTIQAYDFKAAQRKLPGMEGA